MWSPIMGQSAKERLPNLFSTKAERGDQAREIEALDGKKIEIKAADRLRQSVETFAMSANLNLDC